MLPRRNRINGSWFKRVYRRGKKIRTKTLQAVIMSNNVGFFCSTVVGIKRVKSAVQRNNIRRKMYGIVEEVLDHNQKMSIILLYKGEYSAYNTSEIRREMQDIQRQISALI